MKILLFVNPRKEKALALAAEIRQTLAGGFDITVQNYDDETQAPDFGEGEFAAAFSLGGDGTVLYAARRAAPRRLPVIPLNLGTLGFIAAVDGGDWKAVFDRWREGKAPVSRRLMITVAVERGGKSIFSSVYLNDAVISAAGIAKIIKLDVSSQEGDLDLGRYLSDGLIVATPTGSTAYSVAAGGPILDPEMEAFIINPICPFTLSNRPVVLPAAPTLQVLLEPKQRSGILLTVDGQRTLNLEGGDLLRFSRAPFYAELVACGRETFYRALKTKLAWSGGGNA